MKITTIKDIDLSNYKLAYYHGKCMDHDQTHEQAMALADAGKRIDMDDYSRLNIALIPKNKRLQDCDGDDRDNKPADCNASGFYKYPEGTIFLSGVLGGELQLVDKI